MAIRYREGRASPWQCYWNNPFTGKRESANFSTRHEAEKHDSLIKHRIKFDRESFRKEAEEREEKPQSLTLEACYLEYLKQKQFSKKSLAWQIDAMRYPLKQIGMLPIEKITRKHIEQIMENMLKSPVKQVTVRNRLSVLRTVLRWCSNKEYCAPFAFPKLPPAHYEKFIPPTPEELRSLLENAPPHIARVIILGAQLGIRVGPSELLRLTWDDVDFDRRIVRVHGAMKNMEALWREVPIRESLLQVFKVWHIEDVASGVLHIINYKGRSITTFKKAWKATLRQAGIVRRIRPYDLRHAFATELIGNGIDVGTVAKLMGHSTPTVLLKHYQYVMDRQKRAAVEVLPEISYVPTSMCPKKKGLHSDNVTP